MDCFKLSCQTNGGWVFLYSNFYTNDWLFKDKYELHDVDIKVDGYSWMVNG